MIGQFIRDNLLFLEVGILCFVSFMYWIEDKRSGLYQKLMNMFMLILVAGTPIIYSSWTRSVFEVNKMTLMRLVLVLGTSTWIIRGLLVYKKNQIEDAVTIAKSSTFLFKIVSGASLLLLFWSIVKPMILINQIIGVFIFAGVLVFISAIKHSWKWTGLEWAFLAWLIINSISTIFSLTPEVSIIGAYDRWEGILTVSNYVILVWMFAQHIRTKTSLYWVVAGVLIPTTISAVYGVVQSFGIDFMKWSVDPTQRVFASINNPVHFSAYVGMLVPVGLGFLLHISSLNRSTDRQKYLKWVVYLSTFLCYYALYLSYSRAATLGFVASISIFYMFVLNLFNDKSPKNMLLDFLSTGILLALFYINYIFLFFKHQSMGNFMLVLFLSYFIIYQFIQYFYLKSDGQNKWQLFAANLLMVALFFFDDRAALLTGTIYRIPVLLSLLFPSGYLIYISYKKNGVTDLSVTKKLLVIYLFAKLQFVINSWVAMFIYLLAMTLLFILSTEKKDLDIRAFFKMILYTIIIPFVIVFIFERIFINQEYISNQFGILVMNIVFLAFGFWYLFFYLKGNLKYEKLNMLVSFILLFAIIVFVPSFSNKVSDLFESRSTEKFKAAHWAEGRVDSYDDVAIQGTARTSMWKSSLTWSGIPYPKRGGKLGVTFLHPTVWVDGQDYKQEISIRPIIGTGLDTIKELYGRYRREDYGYLEGGHNFTPDRVHNEYFNTSNTTGWIGFIIRWFWLTGGFFILCIIALQRMSISNPMYFLLTGTLTGMIVHLGQLNFNFSVVATAVLYYVLMGISLAICNFHSNNQEELFGEEKKNLNDKGNVKVWILVVVMVVISVLACFPWVAEKEYRDGYNAFVRKQYNLAIEQFEKACKYAPWETQYRMQLGKAYEEYSNRMNNLDEKISYLKKAEDAYRICLNISPYNPWYMNRISNINMMYFNVSRMQNKPDEAKDYIDLAGKYLKQASDADKNNPIFHMSYGYYLHRTGKVDDAIIEYRRAIEIDERMEEAYFNLSELYRLKNDVSTSIQLLEEVIARNEKFPKAYSNLGKIYFTQNKMDKALFAFQKAVLANPRDFSAYRNLGAVYHKQSQWPKAISAYKQALRLKSDDIMLRRYLAHVYFQAGYTQSAVIEMEKVYEKMPNDSGVKKNLSSMRYKLKMERQLKK